MIRRPPRSTLSSSSAASDVYKRQVAHNHRTPVGEIDLVCRDDATLVIVEVKARSGSYFGEALESIGPRKERRLRAAAAWWMAERGRVTRNVRFDVIVVMLEDD